jgi:hypothetical protein
MRTRVKGNVIDTVSEELTGAVLENNISIVDVVVGAAGSGVFSIDGSQEHLYPNGREFDVSLSTGNDGTYTVSSAVYNGTPNFRTDITVDEAVSDATIDGVISGYGIDLNGTIITNSGTPVESTDVATKDYVDGSLSSVTIGPSNLAASPPDYDIDISGDAATVGGFSASQFLRSDDDDTTSGNLTIAHSNDHPHLIINDTGASGNPYIQFQSQGGITAEGGAVVQNVNSVSSGYLFFRRYKSGGATAATILLQEDGKVVLDPTSTATDATRNDGNFRVNGAIYATGNVTAFSDVRLKEDIRTIDNAMDKIVQITGYTFTRNDLDDDKRYAGVIAQEVQHVLPEVVEQDEEGMLSIAYGNLVALLIEGMKEQKKEIDELKKRLDKVEE